MELFRQLKRDLMPTQSMHYLATTDSVVIWLWKTVVYSLNRGTLEFGSFVPIKRKSQLTEGTILTVLLLFEQGPAVPII